MDFEIWAQPKFVKKTGVKTFLPLRKAFSVAFLFQDYLKLPPQSTEWNNPFYIFGRGVKQAGGHADLQNVEIVEPHQCNTTFSFLPTVVSSKHFHMLGMGNQVPSARSTKGV